MTYLLDTSVCVAALRAREPVMRQLAAVGPSAVAVSTMTVAELWHGVLKSRAPEATGDEVTYPTEIPALLKVGDRKSVV